MEAGNEPQLLPGADEWLEAFYDLSTNRQIGSGLAPYIGPIPGDSLDRVAQRYGEEERLFKQCIRLMDMTYRKIHGPQPENVVHDTPFSPAMMRGEN